MAEIKDMVGAVMQDVKVDRKEDVVHFIAQDGREWKLLHHQD